MKNLKTKGGFSLKNLEIKGFTQHHFQGGNLGINFKKSKSGAGFTLIELLVVISIIGLLSTLAVVALNNARQGARDAKRVGDIRQIRTALELYYDDAGETYPDVGVATTADLGVGSYGCLDSTGFQAAGGCTDAYMLIIPADPLTGTYEYTYERDDTSADNDCYRLGVSIEGKAGDFDSAGAWYLDPISFEKTPANSLCDPT